MSGDREAYLTGVIQGLEAGSERAHGRIQTAVYDAEASLAHLLEIVKQANEATAELVALRQRR